MLGREDKGCAQGFSNGEAISEEELTNLLTMVLNKEKLGIELDETYMSKLGYVLTYIAEEKIDRTMYLVELDKKDQTRRVY